MKRCLSLFSGVMLGSALVTSCGDSSRDPVSSRNGDPIAPAAKLTVSNAVAATCEIPGCRPGFAPVPTALSAQLSRSQEVPPIPPAGGTGTFSLNADRTALTYEIRVEGIPAVAASHFHNAPAGENGGVVRGFEGTFDGDVWVSSGTWSSTEADQPLTADLVAELLAGNIYVNIHTADYGPGEIRGQVLRD